MKYDEQSIKVLKGLEPVRERPGMYTRTDSPPHIIQEVIDNAADEALGGLRQAYRRDHACRRLGERRGRRPRHPGRPAPGGEGAHRRGGRSRACTRAASSTRRQAGAYAFSGGLHGVGVSVTNALSTRLEVEVKRDGKVHSDRLRRRRGRREAAKSSAPAAERASGTLRARLARPEVFRLAHGRARRHWSACCAPRRCCCPGVKVTLTSTRPTEDKTRDLALPGRPDRLPATSSPEAQDGYVSADLRRRDATPAPSDGDASPKGEGAAWAMAWCRGRAARRVATSTSSPPSLGGTHEAGLRDGVFDAVKEFVEHHGLLPRGVSLQAEDVVASAALRALGAHPRPAVPGPDQGEAHRRATR